MAAPETDVFKIYEELDSIVQKLSALNSSLRSADDLASSFNDNNTAVADSGRQLWNVLTRYGVDQDEQAGRIFAEIEEAQKQLEQLREPLISNFAENFNNRVVESISHTNSFMAKKERQVRASQQQFEQSMKLIGAFVKKAGKNVDQYNKKMAELLKAKSNHEETLKSQLSNAKGLNQAQYLAVVESVLSMLEAQYTYFGQGYAILHEYLPRWKQNLLQLKNQLPLMPADDIPPPPPPDM